MNQQGDNQETAEPGFECILSENCVEYMVFLVRPDLQLRDQIAELEVIRKVILLKSQGLVKNYIWQKDEFTLESRVQKGIAYLDGLTDYGDSIEDEWLIVYILREISQSFPQVWIRLFDNDGEFLLIEAAKALPKWLNPEMDRNRVWINQGNLYIIPRKADELYQSPSITIPNAIDFIKKSFKDLVHSESIQAESFYRLRKYPGHIVDSLHYSQVTLPRKLCSVLHEMPKAVAPAVEAFYLRDALSLKHILSSTEALRFPPSDLVTTSIKFSKILFAQLRSQRFEPPPRWIYALDEKQSSNLSDKDKEILRLETGMKLACGFEMLAKKAAHSDSRIVREFALYLQDLEDDGPSALPTNSMIASWKDTNRDDTENWMDISYEDFERELEGKGQNSAMSGFGDAKVQADLRTIVSRFESFLNDDSAGIEGAELDEMDRNDDEDDIDDADEDSLGDEQDVKEKDVLFNGEEFSRMMLELMGTMSKGETAPTSISETNKGKELEQDEDDQAIRQLTSQFEAELKRHGALKLDGMSRETPRLNQSNKPPSRKGQLAENEGSDEDGEVNIDYNLAKNLLESFKGQAGMSGPTGNLLGLMGVQLPRDEIDEQDETDDTS